MGSALDSDPGTRSPFVRRWPLARVIAPPTFGWALVIAAVGWATWARWSLFVAGPTLDTDAIGHAIIARRLLDGWTDVRVHWVWLPLWHFVGAAFVVLGGGIDAMRLLSMAFAALSPLLLTTLLERHLSARPSERGWLRDAERIIPFASGALLAIWPLCLQVGATGQPEPLFQCLLLGACLSWERRRFASCGVLLALAVMLRYEAWILLVVAASAWALRRPRRIRDATVWAIPATVLFAWCWIHQRQTHEWLQFVRLNREFVRGALGTLALAWARQGGVLRSLARYTVVVPYQSVTGLIVLVIPGLPWLTRRAPRSLVAACGSILSFVTVSWILRQHLGLDRHFVAIAPLYATAIAAGACAGTSWIASRSPAFAFFATRWVAAAVLVTVLGRNAIPTLRFTREAARTAYSSERGAAGVLRGLSAHGLVVYCDLPIVEILSGLPSHDFIRWNVRDVAPYNLVVAARQHGVAAAASTPEHVLQLRSSAEVLFDDGRVVVVVARGR